jgi:5'(3')-deoxyribonucleotidase
MKPKIIMFDIDGVLADFILGFTALASQKHDVRPFTTDQAKDWHLTENGFTKQQLNDTLDEVARTSHFWRDLPLAPNVSPEDLGRIQRLNEQHRVYFVTSRIESGDTLQQTRIWFFKLGITPPNVVMSKKKGEMARALGAHYSIEDKWDNAHCIHWISDNPQTKSYLIDRPYNQVSNAVGAQRVRRIETVKQFLDDVEEGV